MFSAASKCGIVSSMFLSSTDCSYRMRRAVAKLDKVLAHPGCPSGHRFSAERWHSTNHASRPSHPHRIHPHAERGQKKFPSFVAEPDKPCPRMSDPVPLFCLVYGETFSTAFAVEIGRGKLVSHLKELIKEKKMHSCEHIDAGCLQLWRVGIPITKDGAPQKPNLRDEDRLESAHELSRVFPEEPLEGYVSIIVKIPGLLSKSEFLELYPPPLGYINRAKSSGTTKSSCAPMPQSVVTWDDFKDDVMNNLISDSTPQYSRPVFRQYSSICNEETVRQALDENVFRAVNTLLGQDEAFNRHSSLQGVLGQPDFILRDSNRILRLVIEVKSKWTLSTDDLVETYNQKLIGCQTGSISSKSVYDQLGQIFGYLSHNQLQFGALTTYDKTWFLHRPRDNPNQIRISPPIQYNDQQPTLFQCLYHLTSLARKGHGCASASPSSPPLPPHDDSTPPDDNSGNSSCDEGPKRKPGSQNKEECAPLEFFNWESFKVLDVLGSGRSGTVFKANLHGETVALKICDLWQHPEYKKELLHEVEVYHALEDLQGDCIPRLKGAGYTAGGLFAIATDIVGRPLKASVHRRGFVHNDIRKDNILIKRNGRRFHAFLVD
ncbi:hypothetical protein F5I97DRAFT_1885976, partial [Phlebopus sp. FC_14]